MLTTARTRTSGLVFHERGVLVDIALALLTGFGVALAKRTLDFHLSIPGHAGTSWIAVLVLGAMVNRRRGMTLLSGASVGLWGVPLGLGQSLRYNTELYATSAAAIEVLALMRLPIQTAIGAAIAGGIAHIVKFGFVFESAAISGVMKHFELYGTTLALRNHVLFGIAGGLIAWSVFNAGREAAKLARGETAIP